ncbi:MAG: TetR/AcrR family transcriptional regulator [Treponema sp.]|nr:TetR/AcrR family transcriptional regulator [Treponema sp.]
MAQRIIGVSKRLIEAASQEFLKNGFENSSVRTIAEKAQTSPRAIYTRFENKEALFQAVIEPAWSDFMELFKNDKIIYWENAEKGRLPQKPEEYYIKYLDFAYKHKKQFNLLLTCAKGSHFESFTEKLAQMDLDYLQDHLPRILNNQKNISSDLLKNWGISDSSRKLFFESITFSFYKNLFIPFIKEMPFEDAKDYIIKLTQFYSSGITTMR